MAIRLDSNVPVPATTRPMQDSGDITEALRTMSEGQSFFVPCRDERQALVQRRITVRGAQMRERGQIDFYLITRQVVEDYKEDDGTITPKVPGVRVWRRAAGDTEVSGEQQTDSSAQQTDSSTQQQS